MEWSLLFSARVVVFAVSDDLTGDVGAGIDLIGLLREDFDMPDDVALLDAGEDPRLLLNEIKSAQVLPQRVIFVDAVTHSDHGPGEVFELPLDGQDPKKVNDFGIHLFPTMKLLSDFTRQTGVEVKILAVQTDGQAEKALDRLSPAVSTALPYMAQTVKRWCRP